MSPESPKTEFGAQNQYGHVIYPSGILHGARKYMLLGVKKVKLGPQSPETEFVLQNRYCCVISPSIRSIIRSKKIYTFGDQKSENKPSSHKHGF
jgi:hypothetical protein